MKYIILLALTLLFLITSRTSSRDVIVPSNEPVIGIKHLR